MSNGRIALVVLLAFAASVAGVLLGRGLVGDAAAPGAELHSVLHEQMTLDAAQERKLHALETAFAKRRAVLEAEMRAENKALAKAIAAEQDNGPQVSAAVDASHHTMGTLQKETLAHIFAMRALLRPDQTAQFDAAVTGALTEDAR